MFVLHIIRYVTRRLRDHLEAAFDRSLSFLVVAKLFERHIPDKGLSLLDMVEYIFDDDRKRLSHQRTLMA